MDKYLQTMINNMPEKTGKSLEQWKAVLKTKAFTKHSEALQFLKNEHQLTHGFANTIVVLSKDEHKTPDELTENQYKGKESLFPLYQKLSKAVEAFGDDVIITPKKTEVSLDRKRKFAVIRPSTKTRIDLGLKLKGHPTTDRLENSGPFGSMCTHRVKLSDLNQIDNELLSWLEEAYEQAK